MSEADIQNRLRWWIRHTSAMITNTLAYGWETDLLVISPSLFARDYEIKISRSDFRADRKKDRNKLLDDFFTKRRFVEPETVPNYFIYVAPENVIPIEELPTYAGLVELKDAYPCTVVKPKILHREKVSQRILYRALISASEDIWKAEKKRVVNGGSL